MARIGSPRTATRCGSREPVENGGPQDVDRRPGAAIRKCVVPDQHHDRGGPRYRSRASWRPGLPGGEHCLGPTVAT
jgi:hypothetical protein